MSSICALFYLAIIIIVSIIIIITIIIIIISQTAKPTSKANSCKPEGTNREGSPVRKGNDRKVEINKTINIYQF